MSKGGDIATALNELSWGDFSPVKLVGIPCFRDAGLAGFSCLFVFSTVMMGFHGNIRKAANFGVGGFLLGSIFGWEQCNYRRRQQLIGIQQAKERFQNK